MHELSIRKVPGVGRVNERLLESIGIQVRSGLLLRAAPILLLEGGMRGGCGGDDSVC